MPPIVSLDNVSLAYGHVPLLDAVDLSIEAGERVCLVGRNGAGKSTLMGVVNGEVTADDGVVRCQAELRIARLAQDVGALGEGTVFEVVARGLAGLSELITDYHHAAVKLETDHSEPAVARLAQLQHDLEVADGWRLEQRVETVVSRLGLDGEANVAQLSGGVKRRVLLAQALVIEPDLLLLDEPTNHLDIDAIAWLEEFLLDFNGALMFVTHDRTFLRHLANYL